MPIRKRGSAPTQPAVEATLSTVEEALLLAEAPTATAVEVPAVPYQPAKHKKARVHEVFEKDFADTNYAFCQCLKSAGGGVCGQRLKDQNTTSSLWTHVRKKHPSTYASLVSNSADQDDIAAAEETLASSAQLTLNVSYQQMVDTLSCAPADVLSAAIKSLQQASEQRSGGA
jgi:hypothetical protein